jgi:hypothetical protein
MSKRKPRKKGQRRNSPNHSDLYTDENPKGTIKGLKFATVKDAEASVRKIKKSGRGHNHKTQAAIAMEQRAIAAGKKSSANVYRKFIEQQKKKTAAKNESLVKDYVRSLLIESMKMPSDLPDSAYVVIDDNNDRYFEVVIEDPDTPIFTAFGATTLASLQVSKAPAGYCDGAWQIIGAAAKDGYGPLAYDIAMEYVGHEGIMCDRSSVSEEAAKVWDFYLNSRPDVKAVQLDSVKKPFLTPEDTSDDCTGEYTLARHTDEDMAVGFNPYENEKHRKKWIDHWSTKKYVKTSGSPIIDALNEMNILYYSYEEIGMGITENNLRRGK